MRNAGGSNRFKVRLTSPALWVCVTVVCPSAAAQEDVEATPVEEQSKPRRWFSLDRLDAFIELEGNYDQTRVRSDRGRRGSDYSQTNRNWGFQESLGFDLDGWLIDPGVFRFGGQVSFGLTQDHYREHTPTFDLEDDDFGHLLRYDLRADFFTGKKLSGSVYGLRKDNRINRQFQPTLDETRTGFGTNWYFADDKFPMELRYDYLETDRTGNRNKDDDEHYTESNLYYGAQWLVSEHHRFKFTFEHAESKQEYQGFDEGFETTRDLFSLEHDLEFGDEKQHSFHNIIQWQEESGDFARDLFQIGPRLTLKHSDSLQTIYSYQFNREKYEQFDVATHRADFQIIHQLYTNLTTTVDLFGLYEEFDEDVDTTQYGASVDWQYNRKNRWGHFYAGLSLGYDTEDVSGDNGDRVVLDESATFQEPFDIVLRNRNAVLSSIVVTDTTNRRLYLIGRDYVVWRQRDVVRLARLPNGQIADRETVLIDYRYETPADGKIDTERVAFNVEQRFENGLIPYYRWNYRNQELDSTTGFARYADPSLANVFSLRNDYRRFADRTDHHRIGLRYEKKRYTASVEFEVYDDTVEPYDAFHFDGLVHIIQTPNHTLDTSTRLSRFFFDGGFDDKSVSVVDLQADHHWRLRENLSTFERATFRWQDDSVEGLTHAWDVSAGLEYAMGDLTAEFVVEYDRLNLPGSIEDDVGVYLRIRRDIPNVLARK